MKLLKKSMAVILSVLLAFSLLSVFAFAEEAIITWDGEEEYIYSGELSHGNNEFTEKGNYAFGFTAQQSGVYAINFSLDESGEEYVYSIRLSESIVDGNPVGAKDSPYAEEFGSVYYFDEGEKEFYGVGTEGDISSYSIDIQYLGTVTDFELASNALQADYDVSSYEYEGENLCIITAPIEVTTNTDNNFTVSRIEFSFDGQNLDSGEKSATATLLGFEKEITFNVYHSADYVKDIRAAEGYVAPKVVLDEDGEMNFYYSEDESFNVTFELKDGTFVSNDLEEYSFSFITDDGKKVRLYGTVIKGGDGKFYWAVCTDEENYFIISEAAIEENDDPSTPDDDPEENNEFFLITFLKKIFTIVQDILSYIKSLVDIF